LIVPTYDSGNRMAGLRSEEEITKKTKFKEEEEDCKAK